MKRVERLPIDRLAAGMMTAEPVTDDHGRLLVPAGVVLSELTIANLERHSILTITVQYEAEESDAELEAYRNKLVQRMDYLFRNAGEGAETRALYDTVLAYRMEFRA